MAFLRKSYTVLKLLEKILRVLSLWVIVTKQLAGIVLEGLLDLEYGLSLLKNDEVGMHWPYIYIYLESRKTSYFWVLFKKWDLFSKVLFLFERTFFCFNLL